MPSRQDALEVTSDLSEEDRRRISSPFRLRLGTGRIIPTKFTPPNPNDTPQSLFTDFNGQMSRFVRRNNVYQFLIYTDGACMSNTVSRGGCSFVFRASSQNSPVHGYKRFRLESKGPTGEWHPQTSNRAELRAVIAALRFRYWAGEGFLNLVIATDSAYVVSGITTKIQDWLRNNWQTVSGEPVKNQDLWKCLLGEIERWHDNGMTIQFWRIKSQCNTEAHGHAIEAVSIPGEFDNFVDIHGVLV